MASNSDSRVFHDILVETYKNTPKKVDIVDEKKRHFQLLIFKAHTELKSKNYFEAKKTYLSIIECIETDPYRDELNLSSDIVYCIKCSFCYSCLMDSSCTDMKCYNLADYLIKELTQDYSHKLFPKFLQVILNFRRKNWAMTLEWCNAVELHEDNPEDEYITVDVSDDILPREPQIIAEVAMYEEKSFFNHWSKLATNRLAKLKCDKNHFLFKEVGIVMRLLNIGITISDLDLKRMFYEDALPLWCTSVNSNIACNPEDTNSHQCSDCMRAKINSYAIREKSKHGTKIKFENFLLKLLEAFSKMYECDFIESIEGDVLSKIEEIHELVTGIKEIKQIASEDTKYKTHLVSKIGNANICLQCLQAPTLHEQVFDFILADPSKIMIAQTQTDKLKTSNRCIQTSIQTESLKTQNVRVLAQTQTQTDKLKTGNRCFQTDSIKTRNVEVQAHSDLQLINTVFDIKKLLVNQEKRDDSVLKLNKKIGELTDKLSKETNKRNSIEEDYRKRCTKQEVEIKKLRDQLDECKRLRKEEQEKNVSLQKLFVEHITERFNVHKNIYKTFEKKCIFMVMYLKEISQCLTSTSIPNDVAVQQNIDIWEGHLKKVQADLEQLNKFYKKVRGDVINSEKFNLTWPEVPDFPRDEDNIIFISFKPAIRNIVEIEDDLLKKFNASVQPQAVSPQLAQAQSIAYSMPRPQYTIQSSSYFMGPRFIYPQPVLPQPIPVVPANVPQQCPTFTRERVAFENHHRHQQNFVDHKTWQNHNVRASRSNDRLNRPADKDAVKVVEIVENRRPDVNGAAALASGYTEIEDRSYQEREKMILEYVLENCRNETSHDVTMALLQVVDDNKGTLENMSTETVLEEVKTIFQMKKQSAWVTPKSPHVDWKNDHSEDNCSICFEEFSLKETYTLPCQHEYHKECIKKWLKKSTMCPICRIHSVIDEEFPPLH